MKWLFRVRFLLIIVLFAVGIVLQLQRGLSAAWYLYVAGLLILASQIFFGSVYSAFRFLQRGDIPRAEMLLNQTLRPNWLLPRHRAYYFLTRGMIALKRDQFPTAEEQLKQALALGLSRPLDNAFCSLNLAHIQFVKGDRKASREFLELAKQQPVEDLLIKEHIQRLAQALNQG